MTNKDFNGKITITEGAVRPDLETTPIRLGHMADFTHQALSVAIHKLRSAAMAIPHFSDASTHTLRSICEADEILNNLKARIDFEEPKQTVMERTKK